MTEVEYVNQLDNILNFLCGIKSNEFGFSIEAEEESEVEANAFPKKESQIKSWEVDELCKGLGLGDLEIRGFIIELEEKDLITVSRTIKYTDVRISARGIIFIKTGGFTGRFQKEKLLEENEQRASEKNLDAANKSSGAASDSAKYSLFLLFVTALNVAIVLFDTLVERNQPDESLQKIEDVLKAQNQMVLNLQIRLDSLISRNDALIANPKDSVKNEK